MRIKDYIHDEKYLLGLQVICFIFINIYFVLITITKQDILVMNLFLFFLNLVYHVTRYMKKNVYYKKIYELADNLTEMLFIDEFINEPLSSETNIYHKLLQKSCINYRSELAETEKMRDEYREYIESWVHEIKLPISIIKLICEKIDTTDSRSIKEENEIIEKYVEQALFYARSYNVNNDYFVNETDLLPVVKKALKKHRSQFIAKDVHLDICKNSANILTDAKWLEFVTSQLLDNAVKYSHIEHPRVSISIEQSAHGVTLTITNNGKGISKQDTKRIFEKGFTGENGRITEHSTGMGLYLCNKICDGLGHKIIVESTADKTSVSIAFSSLSL